MAATRQRSMWGRGGDASQKVVGRGSGRRPHRLSSCSSPASKARSSASADDGWGWGVADAGSCIELLDKALAGFSANDGAGTATGSGSGCGTCDVSVQAASLSATSHRLFLPPDAEKSTRTRFPSRFSTTPQAVRSLTSCTRAPGVTAAVPDTAPPTIDTSCSSGVCSSVSLASSQRGADGSRGAFFGMGGGMRNAGTLVNVHTVPHRRRSQPIRNRPRRSVLYF
jgi:hypothetical protein